MVYAIVLEWPQTNEVLLASLDYESVDSIQLLGVKGNLSFKESGTGSLVTFPYLSPESLRWAYVLKITPK